MFAFLTLLAALVVSAGAQAANPLCPKITVVGPASVTVPGDTMSFSAKVEPPLSGLSYTWTVSRGTIESGQNTKEILVRTSIADQRQNLVAAVTVAGAPLGCELIASESGPVDTMPECGLTSDEFGASLKPNDVRGRLDNFFQELSNNPDNQGQIFISVAEGESMDRRNSRLKFIVSHAKFRKFDLDRLVFTFEAAEEGLTQLHRVP
jgi:hypothetical protein